MKTLVRVGVTFLMGAVLVLGVLRTTTSYASDGPELTAEAIIAGAPGSGISGVATFRQTAGGILPTVKVTVVVRGLAQGSTHGVHIHENGSCDNTTVPFGGAGGHFDPGPFGNSNPDTNHPFHMGDLPNLKANRFGVAVIEHRTSRITLSAGPLSVFDANGSAIIIHLNQDQGIPGEAGSGVSGGPRVACGIIRATR